MVWLNSIDFQLTKSGTIFSPIVRSALTVLLLLCFGPVLILLSAVHANAASAKYISASQKICGEDQHADLRFGAEVKHLTLAHQLKAIQAINDAVLAAKVPRGDNTYNDLSVAFVSGDGFLAGSTPRIGSFADIRAHKRMPRVQDYHNAMASGDLLPWGADHGSSLAVMNAFEASASDCIAAQFLPAGKAGQNDCAINSFVGNWDQPVGWAASAMETTGLSEEQMRQLVEDAAKLVKSNPGSIGLQRQDQILHQINPHNRFNTGFHMWLPENDCVTTHDATFSSECGLHGGVYERAKAYLGDDSNSSRYIKKYKPLATGYGYLQTAYAPHRIRVRDWIDPSTISANIDNCAESGKFEATLLDCAIDKYNDGTAAFREAMGEIGVTAAFMDGAEQYLREASFYCADDDPLKLADYRDAFEDLFGPRPKTLSFYKGEQREFFPVN